MSKAGSASLFLINTSHSSIKKQISNGTVILAYLRYFLGCSRPYLTEVREVKITDNGLTVSYTEVRTTKSSFLWSVSARVAFAGGICIDISLSGISSWLLIK